MKKILVLLLLLFHLGMNANAQKPTFNHLAIYVVDLNKSATFYREVIGLDTIANPFNDNRHAWFSIGGTSELHIIAGAASVTKHQQDNHLCFSIASLESMIQALNKAGIPYHNARGKINEITTRPDGVKQIYFTDPDGYWLEINDAKK